MSRAAHALEHHPRQVTALVAALLLTGAGGAFAVATAADSEPDLPLREVIEAVQPLPVQEQAETLDAFRFNLFRTEASRSSDTVESLLGRLGISDPAAAAFLRTDATFRHQVLGQPGRNVTVEATDTQALLKLVSRWPGSDRHFQRFVVERTPSGRFTSRIESAPLVASLRLSSGVVRRTYFEATDEAGIPDDVARQILGIFEGDIDFNRGLHAGDRFNVVYEALEADGEPMQSGRVISAEFVNRGKLTQAMWFQEPGQEGGYFDLDGRSLKRSFLASPMAVTRITSGFKMRFHPILHEWVKHEGIDYGGPVGTAVRSIGDGVVKHAGWMGAYGNLVIVDHGHGDETYYAHLSRIEVRPGQRVQQGQSVGKLGGTGRVTGPHLHFEFRENGATIDPKMALRRNQSPELSAQAKADFGRISRSIRMQFAAANAVPVVAKAE